MATQPLYGENPSLLSPENCDRVAARMRRALREHYDGYDGLDEDAESALMAELWDYIAYDAGRRPPNVDGRDLAHDWLTTERADDWRAVYAPDAAV
jgi:hypothetical protein